MKKVVLVLAFAFCFFCASAAFAQSSLNPGAMSAQPIVAQFPSHVEHASRHALASEDNLLGQTDYTYAQGERPLWEFGPATQPTPLGDIARAYRKDKVAAKKAAVVMEKQGS